MTGRAPRIAWISRDDSPDAFPPVDQAFTEPDGLLAAGGDLSADRLLYAYRHGIFPWYDDGQPILPPLSQERARHDLGQSACPCQESRSHSQMTARY